MYYSGAIQLIVGADFNGTVLGTRVTEHQGDAVVSDKIERRRFHLTNTPLAVKPSAVKNDTHWR